MITALDRARRECGVHLLDPVPYFCDNDACYGAVNGRPLYPDDNHLSNTGAKLLAPMFARIWQRHAL